MYRGGLAIQPIQILIIDANCQPLRFNTNASLQQIMNKKSARKPQDPEPRWQALVALLAVGGLYMALPAALTVVPRWLLLAVISVLLIPTIILHRTGKHSIDKVLGIAVAGIVTAAMIGSLALLIGALPSHKESPADLLRSAVALWITNILIFAQWYWRLDAGGPHHRDRRVGHPDGAFLFPQMMMDDAIKVSTGQQDWSPRFIDYLFLAFNTSTALSPTDVPVLSRWAKVLMMLQATISLAVVALLAGRAVNIL